jgi:hypothetical protein
MANSQFSQTIWVTTEIGRKIHFRDIELRQHNGVFHTNVYHELMTDDDLLPLPFRDIIQRPIQDTLKWVRTALLRAIRYCSDGDDYNEERLNIKFTVERNGFPEIILNDAYEEFLQRFAVYVMYPPFNHDHYHTIRQQVFRYDNIQASKAAKQSIQKQVTLYLPYTPHWDTAAMSDFRQELNNILKDNFGDHPRMKDFSIKILQRRCSPLPINDLLVKKRPDKCYLTLSDMEKDKKSMYQPFFTFLSILMTHPISFVDHRVN